MEEGCPPPSCRFATSSPTRGAVNVADLLNRLDAPPDTAGQAMYHTFQPIIDPTAAVLLMWLIGYYMYKNKMYVRI